MKRSILLAIAGLLTATGMAGCAPNTVTPSPTIASPTPAVAIASIAPGAFGLTGPMASRYFQTATLLEDGRVLITGGCCGALTSATGSAAPQAVSTAASNAHALASAEIFNPATGKFTATGSMNVARYYHTATLLASGRVLIAGGFNEGGALKSAEIYDPASGKFTPTADMANAHSQHTATRLKDGTVLIAGGTPGGANAELYDEAIGRFTPLNPMQESRYDHTATLLDSGQVLIVGGQQTHAQATAELYQPQVGRFLMIGSEDHPPLNAYRYLHTATLLQDGKVLIAGGVPGRTSSELYDPATGVFTPTGSMKRGRYYDTATLLPNGKVLMAGGWPTDTSAELYDPKTGEYVLTGSMNYGRSRQTATLMQDGRVLIAGGAGGLYGDSPAEIYKP